jgi:8-oxo-dGTP pyrophosphatase MutT (NUDIX family)
VEARGDPPPLPPFPVRRSERLYDSPWCALRRDWVELGSGELQEYHVFEISPAVAVVPVLPDGSIVLVWQYRHPHGRTHWEIPAGRIGEHEAPLEAAQRELLEETGYASDRLERLAGFYPTNGISAHYAHLFVARECRALGTPRHDASELMSVHVMSASEVRERLLDGRFEDGFTALALHYHFARTGR